MPYDLNIDEIENDGENDDEGADRNHRPIRSVFGAHGLEAS
jgi:hypothetical protein